MVEARRRDEWDRTATIVANTINAHAGKVVCQPSQIGPFATKQAAGDSVAVEKTDDVEALDGFFMGDD